MPRRGTRTIAVEDHEDVEEEEETEQRRRNPRRGATLKPVNMSEQQQHDDEGDSSEEQVESSNDDDESLPAHDESNDERPRKRGRPRKANEQRRTSSRSTKFTSSMKEPSGESIQDLYVLPSSLSLVKRDLPSTPPQHFETNVPKSPAIRHSSARRRVTTQVLLSSDQESLSEESELESEQEEEEEMRIQRILASRSETLSKWKGICQDMNSSEIDYGSRWFQSDKNEEALFEERFLVKWADLSYLHCSWETESDLLHQVDGAKSYLTTFFRKSENGLLLSADERCDGDYFDPAYCQIDRILEVEIPSSRENFGMVMDKADPQYESGTGRQFLIKWTNTPYSESTFEFERDLILNEVDYNEHVEAYERRSTKPTKGELKKERKELEAERRRTFQIFTEQTSLDDHERQQKVQSYQKDLENHVFCNGGQLRDYQAVGVSWLIANYMNGRSSILADEMGLGKTIQTAVYINMVATKLGQRGPFLIVAPLSTIPHWYREFSGWTGLNTIIYHGSAKDRELIREYEVAYEADRPDNVVGFNQSFLKKCLSKSKRKQGRSSKMNWMAQVVITTPEMLVTDDYSELTAIHWDVLVVDEAHRLKNHASKLANNLRDDRFEFDQKLLLTGTPIQNNMTELWTLLNIVDSNSFKSMDTFLQEYGDIKSKEKIDELHERIRPYILRRLKEDVEKSVPPKEETLIEVELTVLQKQYYRALYEKNVQFLHRNKRKALDGPSINNLAMQLRKCCNHPFLLNGVEEEVRAQELAADTNSVLPEGDFLVKASGKLVLLDKLLPRLREGGHRILIFSQFKIMLDILEDYLAARKMKFERIDGSITGSKRQMAIDRFQADFGDKGGRGKSEDLPFVMLLSTRAGGVGINLTAADTCIIFDSDWNPQNDLQAQARCHRIGQTKSVKVYRLLSRKTYEMQMFHMSSLKMGLDQAVLQGFEKGGNASSGDGNMTKEEVERLLRHGAYDIFNEEKSGSAEAESNDFVQQDIDSILERRSRKVIHENTGSKSTAAGGTFSKASFKAAKTPGKKEGGATEDVDIDDPEFWKKMVGEGKMEKNSTDLTGKKRRRNQANYSERAYGRMFAARLAESESDSDSDGDSSISDSDDWSGPGTPDKSELPETIGGGEGATDKASSPPGRRKRKKKKQVERSKWGGRGRDGWDKADCEKVVKFLQMYGYGNLSWEEFAQKLEFDESDYSVAQIKRMAWSCALTILREAADEDVAAARRRAERAAEKQRESEGKMSIAESLDDGGVLANSPVESDILKRREHDKQQLILSFRKLWTANEGWASMAVRDALAFAEANAPRPKDVLSHALKGHGDMPAQNEGALALFGRNIWPALKSRGWASHIETEGKYAGNTHYRFQGKQYRSPESVLGAVPSIHPELSNTVESVLSVMASSAVEKERARLMEAKNASLEPGKVTPESLALFLQMYAPLPLVVDRQRSRRLGLPRRLLGVCCALHTANGLVQKCAQEAGEGDVIDELEKRLNVQKRLALPHPSWTVRHDAVLIGAIAKHGWIDHDACCRAITEDTSIKWGDPFDDSDSVQSSRSSSPKQEEAQAAVECLGVLKETAARAAVFFTAEDVMINDMKGFNKNLVVEAYGLHRVSSDDAESEEQAQWTVDEKMLQGGSHMVDTSEDDDIKSNEPADLPPKKDLLKRARAVLSNPSTNLSKPSSGQSNSDNAQTPAPSHNYQVLDQGDRCNIFLAELLRGLLKISFSKNSAKQTSASRHLWTHAAQEARCRCDDLKSNRSESGEQDVEAASLSVEMQKIADQLMEVRRQMKKSSSRLAKNILRVMLGVKPIPGKTGEDLFPKADDESPSLEIVETRKESSRKKKDKGDNATGDSAISRAMVRASAGDGSAKQFSDPGSTTLLELTATETLLLSVICSQGLPVWTPHWNDLFDTREVDPKLQGPGDFYAISWYGMGVVAETAAEVWHSAALQKLKSKKRDFEKKYPNGRAMNSQEGQRAQRKLQSLDIEEESKRTTAQVAKDYRNDPEKLAKKCVMLLEALRVRMGPVDTKRGGAAQKTKSDNWLGPNVLRWMGKELTRWAESLLVTDESGKPLSNTAAEFIVDVPRYRDDVAYSVAAVFDKKLCRTVFAQVAQQSRTRSVFLTRTDEEAREIVENANRHSRNAEDVWERPSWWGESSDDPSKNYDYELLSGLLEFGFSGFEEMLVTKDAFRQHVEETGDESRPFKLSSLSRASAQVRANQLTRELSSLDETANMMRMVRDKRVRAVPSNDGPPNMSLVSSSDGTETSSSNKPSPRDGGVQTGIQAFFASSSPNRTDEANEKKDAVIVLLDDSDNPAQSESEDDSVQVLGTKQDPKRKDNGFQPEPGTSSAEKKLRTA